MAYDRIYLDRHRTTKYHVLPLSVWDILTQKCQKLLSHAQLGAHKWSRYGANNRPDLHYECNASYNISWINAHGIRSPEYRVQWNTCSTGNLLISTFFVAFFLHNGDNSESCLLCFFHVTQSRKVVDEPELMKAFYLQMKKRTGSKLLWKESHWWTLKTAVSLYFKEM